MGAPCMGRKRSPRSWPRHAIALSSNAWLALLDFDFALMTSSVPEQSLKLGREARLCLMWTCLPMPHFGATPVPLDDFLGMGTGPFALSMAVSFRDAMALQGRVCLFLPAFTSATFRTCWMQSTAFNRSRCSSTCLEARSASAQLQAATHMTILSLRREQDPGSLHRQN